MTPLAERKKIDRNKKLAAVHGERSCRLGLDKFGKQNLNKIVNRGRYGCRVTDRITTL
jgi:hypothetical protein